MKLRCEMAEKGDCSDPEGELKTRFWGWNRIEIPSQSENLFLNRKSACIGARSSRLHEISGLLDLRWLRVGLNPFDDHGKRSSFGNEALFNEVHSSSSFNRELKAVHV